MQDERWYEPENVELFPACHVLSAMTAMGIELPHLDKLPLVDLASAITLDGISGICSLL